VEQTFRKRLWLGHASIVLVIVLSTATALVALRATIRQTERTSEIDHRIVLIDQLRANARELARSTRRFLLTGDLEEQQRVLAIEAEMNQDRTRVAKREQALDDGLDNYIGAVVSGLGNDRTDPGAALARFEDDLIRARGPLSLAFDNMIARERAQLEASRSSQRLARGAQWALVIAAALGVLLTIGSTLVVSALHRRHSDRVHGAEAVADQTTAQRKELLAASDELRRPLATIMTQAAELRTSDRTEGEARMLGSIGSLASRVDSLLRQLLDVTAVQAGTVTLQRGPCDVTTLLDRAIDHHRDTAHERGIRLQCEARLSLTVTADSERITQVLTTLLGHAITSARIGAEIVTSTAPTDDGVRFAIIDAGAVAGPPSELVLHLAQRVIEAHGGRMGIEAATAGRTYWFTLPTEPRLLR
jgi:signal transduction histidine kinase